MNRNSSTAFHESALGEHPSRELGASIRGTPLSAILDDFVAQLKRAGVTAIEPHFYPSTEWGAPFRTISIAVPFELVDPHLEDLHARDAAGWADGAYREDILRYLRHEMGHVINYAYLLYERPDWIKAFGSITRPYLEQYRPQPWSSRFVRHLPGWYAQKHPDEDWAETFAVWLTPDRDWRAEYGQWPIALEKLQLCERFMRELGKSAPPNTAEEPAEDPPRASHPLSEFYASGMSHAEAAFAPPGLDGSLRAIFGHHHGAPTDVEAATLIRGREVELMRALYTWTGHFPEQLKPLLNHLESRAEALALTYPKASEEKVLLRLTAFLTSLAMTHVYRGSYGPRS